MLGYDLATVEALEERFCLKDFIRRLVATIDNLLRQKVALQLMAVKPNRWRVSSEWHG